MAVASAVVCKNPGHETRGARAHPAASRLPPLLQVWELWGLPVLWNRSDR